MPKKKGPRKPDRSEGGDPIPLHPRAMEKEIQEIGKQLRGKEFESVEEAQAFLEEMLESAEGLQPIPAEPSTPLEKAQELIYEAFETGSHRKRVQLAKKALKVSSDCADAYVLLAEETAKDPEEAKELYEKGYKQARVRSARRSSRRTPVTSGASWRRGPTCGHARGWHSHRGNSAREAKP